MKITTKIGLSFTLLTTTLIAAGISGFSAVGHLSQSLDTVTGPVWDTATGAMEGRIALEHQIIIINKVAESSKTGKYSVPATLKMAEKHSNHAFDRMFAANKIPLDMARSLQGNIASFNSKREQLLENSERYANAIRRMNDNSEEFISFMDELESLGDSQIEALADSATLEWPDVEDRWAIADGAMELGIMLLSRIRDFTKFSSGGVPVNIGVANMGNSALEIEEQIEELLEHAVFDNDVDDETYGPRSYSDVLNALYIQHRSLTKSAIGAFVQFNDSQLVFDEIEQTLMSQLQELERFTNGVIESENRLVEEAKGTAKLIIAVALIFGLMIAAAAIAMSILTIARPLQEIVRNLRNISQGEGDLTVSLDETREDEIGDIAHGFNLFVEKVRGTIIQVSDSTGQLSSAAASLSATTTQTNQAILQQHSETTQVATAMNQMTATVTEVANHADRAANSAVDADTATRVGQQIVTKAITTINNLADRVDSASQSVQELSDDSDNIGSVLAVIQAIAEQTNLLALNAAIEAARAGEQGRGFAVVADEVRTLASRTQDSTQEIQQMIEKIQNGTHKVVEIMNRGRTEAKEGVSQMAEAGNALDTIASAVSSISEMNALIASATIEQKTVAEDMNHNIINISQLSDQTAEGSRETSCSSEELAQLSGSLRQLVGRFRA